MDNVFFRLQVCEMFECNLYVICPNEAAGENNSGGNSFSIKKCDIMML